MKLSLESLYTSIKDDGLSYGENRTCLATLVFEIYRKQKIVGMWLVNFVTHCMFMHHIYIIFIFFDYFYVAKFELYHHFYSKSTNISICEKSNVNNSFLFTLVQAINTANAFSFFIWI